MPEWLGSARREFVERVRTIWFAVVTLLGPIAMVAVTVVPSCLAQRTDERAVIHVVDRTNANLFPDLTRIASMEAVPFDLFSVPPTTDEAELHARLRDGKINGFLIIPADALRGAAVTYRGDNATNVRVRQTLTVLLNGAAVLARAHAAGISDETLLSLREPRIDLEAQHDTGQGEASSGAASFAAGFAVMFVLYLSILLYAVNVMRSVIQEKTSRVVELVVSAVKPRSLMFGKVIGVGSVGLLQLVIWAAIALLLINFRAQILGLFGLPGSDIQLPPLTLIDVAVILAYFAGGYFLYAALYAAIGAMVNSEQEAQQMQAPVVLLLVFPMACLQLVGNDPRGDAAQLLTAVPLWSPVLMPMRYLLGGASLTEVGVSLALVLASVGVAVALAGRIYRVGILMYGKRPSLRELARWIRYS